MGGIEGRLEEFSKEIRHLLKKEAYDKTAAIVLDRVKEAVRMTSRFIPKKAIAEIKLRDKSNKNIFRSNTEYNFVRNFLETRYKWEEKLLEARHPKRVEKLWNKAKPILEERYGRTFESREDFARMLAMFSRRGYLLIAEKNLKNAQSEYKRQLENAKEKPGKGWEEISKLQKEYKLIPKIKSTAETLVGLIKDVTQPKEFDEPDVDFDGMPSTPLKDGDCWNHVNLGSASGTRDIDSELCYEVILKYKAGRLTFGEAFALGENNHAIDADIKNKYSKRWTYFSAPEIVYSIIWKTIHNGFQERDEDCTKVLTKMSEFALERWKITAPDYDNVFTFHDCSSREQDMIFLYHRMKTGERYNEESKEKMQIGRLPGLLREMVEDGVIKESDIDPPLKEKYRGPDEVLSAGGKLLTEGKNQDAIASLEMIAKPGIIATTVDPKKMLPACEEKNIPILRDDLSELGNVLDKERTYYVLYKGKHTLWLAADARWPNGSFLLSDVHRLTLLKEDVNPREGGVVRINGERFYVKKEASREKEKELESLVFDSNADATPINSFTVITDVPSDEFREKYFNDFIVHAFVNKVKVYSECVLDWIKKIDEFDTTNTKLVTGSSNRVFFSTFELGGNFGFNLQYLEEWAFHSGELPIVAKSLTGYLEEVGVPYRKAIETNEQGRSLAAHKMERRKFQDEHQEGILNALKGSGLAKVIAHSLNDKKYNLHRVGQSDEPCKHCKQFYIDGTISNKEQNEQWCEGVKGEDLHALSCHPETFINQFRDLEKIYRLVCDAKDYTPEFVKYPQVLPEMHAFAASHEEYLKADAISFNYYINHQGSVDLWYEEEEIEDSPALKEAKEEEIEGYRRKDETNKKSLEAAKILQQKYEELGGDKIDEDKIRSFWSKQLMFYNIYQIAAPKLLPDGSKQTDEPIINMCYG